MSSTTNKDSKNMYWTSLDQVNKSVSYEEFLANEFPQGAQELKDPVTRRNFMKIMGASAALAGLTACRMPAEEIVPFVKSPKKMTPGKPKYYATSMTIGNHAQGLLVENHDGRPTKIQGNDLHPSSKGGIRELQQASILSLYDPERKKVISSEGNPKSWAEFETFWRTQSSQHHALRGSDLGVISAKLASPTLQRLKKEFLQKFPQATWVEYEAIDHDNIIKGLTQISGKTLLPYYKFDQAQVILSIGHDFLGTDLDSTRHQKEFSKKRRIRNQGDGMNRLYTVESSFSLTGSNADHRIRLNPSEIEEFVEALYVELSKLIGLPKQTFRGDPHQYGSWITAVAKDLIRHPGKTIVSAGQDQSPNTHALVHIINQALRNTGSTVLYTEVPKATQLKALQTKIKDLKIQTLVVLDSNPAYTAPNLWDAKAIKHLIVASIDDQETSNSATWSLPLSHFLESWSDAQSIDGSKSIIQPMIKPLFDTKSMVEILYMLTHLAPKDGYEIVQETWKGSNWNQILHDGVLVQNQLKNESFSINRYSSNRAAKQEGVEIQFKPSMAVYDGRFANNGWLQEMPHPITKITWDNPAWVSPAMASAYGLKNGQMIKLSKNGQSLNMPVFIVPGQADKTITLELGYGRTVCGSIGKGVGFNTYSLRNDDVYSDAGFALEALSDFYSLSNTQSHPSMEGRPLVREATLSDFEANPMFAKEAVEHPPLESLWQEHTYDKGYQWGMSIDLNTCTGCNACLISCQSENNIPIVGKEQVKNGREMHWIRLDRYFNGPAEDPMIVFQPVACVHCENAPCEQVCPVNATVHDDEGLNTMVYNRCIGTRYCSNNCPYKVRRFNFFNFIKESPMKTHENKIVQMANNPDVSIRFRGVMEKCTYCTQRIEEGRSVAKLENREIRDGEIKTACQQSCPSDAIVFGNILDPESEVSKLKKLNQDYAMLSELNIKPRTTYLAKFRNPNPEISGKVTKGSH